MKAIVREEEEVPEVMSGEGEVGPNHRLKKGVALDQPPLITMLRLILNLMLGDAHVSVVTTPCTKNASVLAQFKLNQFIFLSL